MSPTLIAFAGRSRVGKGTAAAITAELAGEHGYTSFERQLSDNGKWHLARIFFPEISRVDAVAWFEKLKQIPTTRQADVKVQMVVAGEVFIVEEAAPSQPLQKFIQHGLQEGGRDIFGEHFWTDMIIERGLMDLGDAGKFDQSIAKREGRKYIPPMNWWRTFFDEESKKSVDRPTDLALISDLRQPNEAERVHDCKGLVVEIHRPDVEDGYITGKDHITERGLPTSVVDYYLNSTGDLDYFREIVTDLFNDRIIPLLKENA